MDEEKNILEYPEEEKKERFSFLKNKQDKIRKWPIIKWCLAALVLIVGIVFVQANNHLCYNTYTTEKVKDPEKKVHQLATDSICEQEIKGYNGTLQRVYLYLDNQGMESASGRVVVRVKDKQGNVLGKTHRAVKRIRTRKFVPLLFEEQPKLHQGNTYILEIRCKNVQNPQGFGIYTSTVPNQWLGKASIEGRQLEKGTTLRCMLEFRYYDSYSMKLMMSMMILGVIIILIPFEYLGRMISSKFAKSIHLETWLSRIVFLLAPAVAYFIMESLSGYSLVEIAGFFITWKGLLNLFIYYVILFVLFAVTNKTQYSAILLWIITFVLGMTNYFVFQFRGIPVLAADILSVGTALNVADSFEYTYDIWVLWAVSILVTFTGIMLSFMPYKGFRWPKRIGTAALAVVLLILTNYIYITSDITNQLGIKDSQWKPQLTYEENGSMLSFTTSWRYIKTEKPEGYSVKKVEAVAKQYLSDKTDKSQAKSKKMPNVIAIMNESLADFSYDGELLTSEDYLSFIHSMKKNTIKGKLYVSIEGANTANSEFEFLTGNSLAFFAPRAVPYNNYVNNIVPSLTRTLVSQGYVGNNAYHPYKRSGWNREHVYNCLGFGTFYSEEHYENAQYIRNFISDKTNMEQIIQDYETAKKKSSDPFYLFNVTVQNHGGYVGNRGFVKTDVKSKSPGMKASSVDQYLTLAKKSDEAFELLITYFEKVKEPTVIVMFGDHQPPLSNKFYSNLFGTNIENFTAEQTAAWYSTPYIIWANYDIEEKENLDMSANYLSSYLLQLIGADMTGYNKYLLELQKKVPVLTGMFYAGDDGVFHDIDETSQYTKFIREYGIVQYNGLLDQKHRVKDFFFLQDGDYELPKRRI